MNFPDVQKPAGAGGGLGGGAYLKLEDGARVRGVFMGDPHVFRQHWPKGGQKSICTEDASCAACKAGDRAKFRFAINFMVKIDDVWQARVFENGYGTYEDLKALHADYGLPMTLVTLSRSGKDKETRYSIMPVKDNGGWKADNFKKLAAIPLVPLKGENASADASPQAGEDDVPF